MAALEQVRVELALSSDSPLVGALIVLRSSHSNNIRPAAQNPTAALDELRAGSPVAILGKRGGRGAKILGLCPD
jgi:hypothetical protein